MVKCKGPLASAEAAGQVAAALIFTRTKRGTNLKTYAKPAQPKTDHQVPIRAAVRFLSKAWQPLTPAEKDTWRFPGADWNLTAYHAYLKYNLKRWRNYRGPSKEYPAAEIIPALVPSPHRAYAGYRYAWTETNNYAANQQWALIIHRATTVHFPETFTTIIAIQARPTTGYTIYKDTPLDPGHYYYSAQLITPDGNIALPTYDWHVLVT